MNIFSLGGKSTFILLFLLVFSSSNLFGNNSYNDNYDGKSIAIVPFTNYRLSYDLHLDLDLLREELLIEYLEQALKLEFDFGKVEYSDIKDLKYHSVILASKKYQFRMQVPEPTSANLAINSGYDFFLIIEDLRFSIDYKKSVFSADFKFLIWDVKNQREDKFGKLKISLDEIIEIDKNEVHLLILKCVKEIKKITEFKSIKKSDSGNSNSPSYSALSIKLSPSYYSHLIKRDEDNPNIPNQYENPQDHPSLAHIYGDKFSFEPSIEYSYYHNDKRYSFAFSYHSESLDPDSRNKSLIQINDELPSSQKLEITSYIFSFSLGFKISGSDNFYWYGRASLASRSYYSTFSFNDINAELKIRDIVAPGLSVGFDYVFPNSNFGIFAEGGFESSTVYLESIKIQSDTGFINQELSDNRIKIKAGLSYNFVF
ncbi:MAG: hypothetical protein HND52_14515 [Ignavibacteriae bacterium]|nr:hypothetical protein [Ignavibacteriota bacterium]NOG99167.1 hypothetical protein [Ignavibacteriota bacterium]